MFGSTRNTEVPLFAALIGTIGLVMLGYGMDLPERFDTFPDHPIPVRTNATPIPVSHFPHTPPISSPVSFVPIESQRREIITSQDTLQGIGGMTPVIVNPCKAVLRSWYCPREMTPSQIGANH